MSNTLKCDIKCVAVQKLVFAKTCPGKKVNDFQPRNKPGRRVRADGLAYLNDICYDTEYPNSHFDIWYPDEDTEVTHPTVVYFHGGGMLFGDKVMGDPMAVEQVGDTDFLAEIARQGFTVVNANYALSPEYRFPVQLIQVDRLLCFLQQHADEYHLDMKRVFLSGSSAGANMSEMYGVLQYSPEYAALVGVHPTFPKENLLALLIDESALNVTHFEENMNAMLGCSMGSDNPSEPEILQKLDAAQWIGEKFLPCFINTSNHEIWFEDSARELAAALEKNGTEYELFYRGPEFGKLEHGYMQRFRTDPCAKECFDHMMAFARHRLEEL